MIATRSFINDVCSMCSLQVIVNLDAIGYIVNEQKRQLALSTQLSHIPHILCWFTSYLVCV